ncbi:MAG: hypothetical protein ABEI80_00380 [Haloplanus sp.]
MNDASADRSGEQSDSDYYLPGTPSPSTRPGPIERFLTRLFRRRGRF